MGFINYVITGSMGISGYHIRPHVAEFYLYGRYNELVMGINQLSITGGHNIM